jgi:ABC-type multidrug transport system fused ATPase/permease subunit
MLGSLVVLIALSLVGLALAIGGLWVVRHFVDHQTLMTHHDVSGYMLSIVGTLYAVVLGLIVVGSLTRFQQARLNVENEANTLHDIFHLAQGLPKDIQVKIRSDCRSYAGYVVNEEWQAMELGGQSENAHVVMSDFWNRITTLKPVDGGQGNVQSALLSQLDELGDCRHTRLLDAKPEFDPYIWAAIISGGVILIVFTYFFGVEKFAVQALMTGLVTIVLAINWIIIALFGYPYSGDVKVSSDAFSSVSRHFDQEVKRIGY